VRANPKLSGTRHNVFGIQTGVAISFMIRRAKQKGCRVFYARRPEFEIADEKLAFLGQGKLRDIAFDEIRPDAKHNWINLAQNDFELLLPAANKITKTATRPAQEKAIFKLFSLGISTNRDEWVYDDDPTKLAEKMKLLVSAYSSQDPKRDFIPVIKWSRNLKRRFSQGRCESFDAKRIVSAAYRPFHKRYLYDSNLFIDEGGSKTELFPFGEVNTSICFSDVGSRTNYCVLAVSGLADLHFGSAIDAYQQVALYRWESDQRIDNITSWGSDQFRKHYEFERGKRQHTITKKSIFYYVYGVLHDPNYREKYRLNLKREFPRIPFYKDFWQWAEWGKELMDLHLGYESVTPSKLKRIDMPDEKARNAGLSPKCILKADKDGGRIIIDSETTLSGIPSEAWDYRLGNRSALEWILDQYKEKKPKDPTIREKFNTYRFAEYKEKVIDLLMRVTTVSVRTVTIVNSMKGFSR
jgi:predicted helicase